MDPILDQLDALLAQLSTVAWKEREAVKQTLLEVASAAPDRDRVREHLEAARKDLDLEVRWEVDEVLEALAPPPEPEPEPEPEEESEADDPDRPLRQSDLVVVYDDPRGLVLYRTKKDDRWFATQVHPQTGQPQTFELHPQEVEQLKKQLQGSPYWVIGA
jgi:hypothetical protein